MILKFPLRYKTKYLVVFALLLLISCKHNRRKVDLSKVPDFSLKVSRFEQDLFMHRDQLPAYSSNLKKDYGEFYKIYCRYIIRVGSDSDSVTVRRLKEFALNADLDTVYKHTQNKFKDLKDVERGLSTAFRHLKYYYPEATIPQVISYISGFRYAVITATNGLAIGLDMYLGKDYAIYAGMGYPAYKIRTMDREYIVSDAMKGWAQSEYANDPEDKEFISQCIYWGKIYYYTESMLPDQHDSLTIGFSNRQLQWCKANEGNVWAYFIEKKLLFSNNPNEYNRFLGEGPTTNSLPKESPAMLGRWIGWQIVRKYMNQHSDVSLKALMETKDAHKILNESQYKPEK